jgi:hypothetical protein
VAGRRSPAVRLLNAYVDRVQATATYDAEVAGQFVRVIGLLDPPAALMRPSVLTRCLLPSQSRRHALDPIPSTTA